MKKLKYFLPMIALATLTACGPGNSKSGDTDSTWARDSAAMPAVPVFECKMMVDPDNDKGIPPLTIVSVKFGDKTWVMDSVAVCSALDPSDYKSYEIPAEALSACGGYYAGGGDYFYLKKEGADYLVMYGFSDEGLPESDLYQYKEVKRFPQK